MRAVGGVADVDFGLDAEFGFVALAEFFGKGLGVALLDQQAQGEVLTRISLIGILRRFAPRFLLRFRRRVIERMEELPTVFEYRNR